MKAYNSIKVYQEYTNLFSSNDYENNNKIILKYLQQNLNELKRILMFSIKMENLKKLKYHISFLKYEVFLLFTVSVIMNMKKYLKKKNQLKY